ncbi:hypothetical protein I551_4818 [Mycobacterium ulcerans str. Harvey]|uniref:Uncharacterized protein n=1 Tax=Mycobacterium ulcerans str. Harvey TaxID=1299332 RepID=A0ABP3AG30_MYCUL|nr:hypothetical protein I551_4818 [Mycobacterium ulcerans str. Harvey]
MVCSVPVRQHQLRGGDLARALARATGRRPRPSVPEVLAHQPTTWLWSTLPATATTIRSGV